MSLSQQRRVEGEAGSYRDYSQDHVYSHDHGLVVLPVAGRAAGHRVIRLHGGIATRTVNWSASRGGRPPLIPAAADTNGDTLLSSTIVPTLPRVNAQARSYDWSVSGTYVYVQNTPRVPGVNAFPAGNHPYAVLPQAALAAGELPSNLMTPGYSGNRADAQTEYLTGQGGHNPENAGYTSWPLTVLPAAYSSTHIIGG